MKCSRCKSKLRKEDKFCAVCGARVGRKRRIRFTSIFLVIVLLLSLIAIGWSGSILFTKHFSGKLRDLFSGKKTIETHNVGEVISQAENAITRAKELGPESEYKNHIAEVYLQSVTYEIITLDKENGIATLEVSVPNVAQLLPQIVNNVLAENTGESYDALLQIVQSELERALSDEGIERTTTTIDFPIEYNNGEYEPIYTEQWEQLVFGSLEDMYIEYYRTMIGEMHDEIPE